MTAAILLAIVVGLSVALIDEVEKPATSDGNPGVVITSVEISVTHAPGHAEWLHSTPDCGVYLDCPIEMQNVSFPNGTVEGSLFFWVGSNSTVLGTGGNITGVSSPCWLQQLASPEILVYPSNAFVNGLVFLGCPDGDHPLTIYVTE